jgi:XTP/dITP diphosphohydrolase
MDILEIVKKKAEDAYYALGKPVMVEDTGFFIEAHQGFPGPFIKYIVD